MTTNIKENFVIKAKDREQDVFCYEDDHIVINERNSIKNSFVGGRLYFNDLDYLKKLHQSIITQIEPGIFRENYDTAISIDMIDKWFNTYYYPTGQIEIVEFYLSDGYMLIYANLKFDNLDHLKQFYECILAEFEARNEAY